ncbi:cytochrome c peroxidase [Mesorhizobium sp. J18]|nr:cytochrome c peroxidase [Mesorhizobium sp. J18]
MAALGLSFLFGMALAASADAGGSALDRLKALYARPDRIPFPVENPYSPAKAELGRRLFHDPVLSGNGTMSCASCHQIELGFEQGVPLGTGTAGEELDRHTPTLWNVAWGETFFWDGRAPSLEAQAMMPIQSRVEMNQSMDVVVSDLKADADYRAAFARAFPENPDVTAGRIFEALATFERTLVPAPDRFARWIDGEEDALDAPEKRGFVLFNGKARCARCHAGFAFTDGAFHDIGLADEDDPGRGAVIGVAEASHAFKTPTLIDVADRAPYMHDGSLPDLQAVLDHYQSGIVARPTLSPDLQPITLSEQERSDLIAFLESLDVSNPMEEREIAVLAGPPLPPAADAEPVETDRIVQQDLAFMPGRVMVEAGAPVSVLNDDTRTHTVDVNDPKLKFTSGANKPGEKVEIIFPEPGDYTVVCSIHPRMRLHVEAR